MPHGGALQPEDIVEVNPLYLLRWEEPQQGYVLLYPEGIVKLNPAAAEILTLVTGTDCVRDIADRIETKYDAPEAAADVLAFLKVSHDKGWIRIKA